jgi:elongator complex protein 3
MPSYNHDYTQEQQQILAFFRYLEERWPVSPRQLQQLVKKFPKKDHSLFSKDLLGQAYRELAGQHGLKPFRSEIAALLQLKPTRTISGVTPVTVLTKPFPCPGKCIFCPNDIRMPKSYLADEPGAQRAERNFFDPYLQTYNRLQAFSNIGHPTDKIEIIVLGGTWSYYHEPYQIWFIKECFRALNDFSQHQDGRPAVLQRYQEMEQKMIELEVVGQTGFVPTADPQANQSQLVHYQIHGQQLDKSYNQVISALYVAPERKGGFDKYQSADWPELLEQQRHNETASCRNVGLVIETRPDNISPAEVLRIRKLGCTKTQIGFQSLNDKVLQLNKRGHDVEATRRAVNLLRQAGFKIHAHWMPNLYGSTVKLDQQDYHTLFTDPDFKPDELKIYPCSLIESAELMQYYQRGEWHPYSEEELLEVLSYCLRHTPEYCRLTRVIRDIPSTDIVVGNKKTNFREIAQRELAKLGEKSQDIRAREVRAQKVTLEDLELRELPYQTSVSNEIFLQFVTKPDSALGENKIAGFLRLSLPTTKNFIDELKGAAIIREVHVYGQAVNIGDRAEGKAQHLGLGTKLLVRAKELAAAAGFNKLAVISAVGTREYYRSRGFSDGELYQFASL